MAAPRGEVGELTAVGPRPRSSRGGLRCPGAAGGQRESGGARARPPALARTRKGPVVMRPERLPCHGAQARAARGSARERRVPCGSCRRDARPAGSPGPARCGAREEALPPGAQALCSRLQHWVRRDTGHALDDDSSVTALAVLCHAW